MSLSPMPRGWTSRPRTQRFEIYNGSPFGFEYHLANPIWELRQAWYAP
uniref:Uncharacterized protein n=1 Tax=Arundo donax TaxID=35708 RepID=A0A0A8ZA03_ARUDO